MPFSHHVAYRHDTHSILHACPPIAVPQPLIRALGCLKFEQNRQFNWKIAIQLAMHFEKIDQPLPKNEAAYRLQPDAPVAQLDRVRGYEPHSRFLSLPDKYAVS